MHEEVEPRDLLADLKKPNRKKVKYMVTRSHMWLSRVKMHFELTCRKWRYRALKFNPAD